MVTRAFVAVDRGMSLHEFVNLYLLQTTQRCFVVKDHGRLAGLITRRDVSAIPRERWGAATLGDAMRPLRELQIVTPGTRVVDAMKLAASDGVEPLPVVENGRLQGIVFRSQLVHALQHPAEMSFPPAYQQLLYGSSKVAEERV